MMRSRDLFVAAAAVVAVATGATLSARQLKTPADWKWRLDTPGAVVEAAEPKAGETRFVAMPPGWHVTCGPAALLYHPDYQGKGNFVVEVEIFLFPGDSQEEYGIFIGGKSLGPGERPSYLALVSRRDGMGRIRRDSGEPLVDWKANDAILPHPGKDAMKNVPGCSSPGRISLGNNLFQPEVFHVAREILQSQLTLLQKDMKVQATLQRTAGMCPAFSLLTNSYPTRPKIRKKSLPTPPAEGMQSDGLLKKA